jgi:hypothetical protein
MALLAVLALVGALALTGCRSQPGAAIYVGSTVYTQKQVDKLAAELKDVPTLDPAQARHLVTQWIVMRDVAQKMTAQKGWAKPDVNVAETAQTAGLPPNAPLTKLFAEYQAYNGVVSQHAKSTLPNEADWAELYQRFKAAGLLAPTVTEESFRGDLKDQDLEVVASRLGVRALYAEGIKSAHVVVNPKYGPAEVAVLADRQNSPLLMLPLNSKPAAAPVRNG